MKLVDISFTEPADYPQADNSRIKSEPMDPQTDKVLSTGWLVQGEPSLRDRLLKAGRIRRVNDGSLIYDFQQEQSCLWGVISGVVRISVTMNEQDPKLAHCAGPGFWFGEVALLTGQGRAVRAVACGETRLCTIDRADISEIARDAPDVWRMVATISCMNQLIAIGAGDDLMIRDARKRLVAVLLRLSGHRNAFQGAQPIDTVPITQIELADASALSRSKAAEILRDLVENGVISTDYGSIRILDPISLKRIFGI